VARQYSGKDGKYLVKERVEREQMIERELKRLNEAILKQS
jgi:hypothetical protein